jgi:sugar lactone lactonase YvrE
MSFIKYAPVIVFLLASCQSPEVMQPPTMTMPPALSENNAPTPIQTTSSLETLSGTGAFGYAEGPASQAQFYHPSSIIRLNDGALIVLDRLNYILRKVDPVTGETTAYWGAGLKGNRDGDEAEARLNDPFSLLAHSSGAILITDSQNHTLRHLSPEGKLTTIAGTGNEGFKDGQGVDAAFNWPADIVEDTQKNLYVSDRFNHAIRKITPEGKVSTLAGDGEAGYDDSRGKNARFNEPMGLAIGPDNVLYVADSKNHVIRKVTLDTGEVTTYAGSGFEGSREDSRDRAEFRIPTSIAFDKAGRLLIVDRFNHRIREITVDEQVHTLIGTGQPELLDPVSHQSEGLSYPVDMVLDPEGNMYIVDYGNHAIRKVTRP